MSSHQIDSQPDRIRFTGCLNHHIGQAPLKNLLHGGLRIDLGVVNRVCSAIASGELQPMSLEIYGDHTASAQAAQHKIPPQAGGTLPDDDDIFVEDTGWQMLAGIDDRAQLLRLQQMFNGLASGQH